MRKALIITYYWPPSGGSGVQRWLKLTKYLPQFGYKPIVYTPLNPEVNSIDSTLEADISPEVEVIKHPIKEPYSLYKRLKGIKKGEQIKANLIDGEKNRGIANYIRANFFIPDPRKWWIKPSVKFLSEWLKHNEIDVIISTGPPHSMHLIGSKLREIVNVPWIADFRDPWTDIFYFKHLQLTKRSLRKHLQLEEHVISHSQQVVVVSNQMYEDFLSKLIRFYLSDIVLVEEGGSEFILKSAKKSISVIENGFDPDDFDEKNNMVLSSELSEIEHFVGDKFIIAHTGLLTDSANPNQLWRAIGKLVKENNSFAEKLLIVTAGEVGQQALKEIEENGLSQYHLDLKYSSHLKCVALQKKSHIQILPLRKEPEAKGILTGKFFEYMASGSPIIAFGVPESDVEQIINKTNSGTFFLYSDTKEVEENIKKEILRIWDAFTEGKSLKNQSSNIVEYSRVTQAEKFAKLMNRLIDYSENFCEHIAKGEGFSDI